MSEQENQEKEPIKFTFTNFLYVMAGVVLLVAILCAATLFTGAEPENTNINDTTITTSEVDEEKEEIENVMHENNINNESEVVSNSTLMVSNTVDNTLENTVNTNEVELPETNVVETNKNKENTVTPSNTVLKSNDYSGVTNGAFVPNN